MFSNLNKFKKIFKIDWKSYGFSKTRTFNILNSSSLQDAKNQMLYYIVGCIITKI